MNVKQQVRVSRTSGSIGAFRELASGVFRPPTLLLHGNGASGEGKGVFDHFAGAKRVSLRAFGVSFGANETPNRPNGTPLGANEPWFGANETPNRANGTSNRAFGVSFAPAWVSFALNEHPNGANETSNALNETPFAPNEPAKALTEWPKAS